jgi:hypothetical protein
LTNTTHTAAQLLGGQKERSKSVSITGVYQVKRWILVSHPAPCAATRTTCTTQPSPTALLATVACPTTPPALNRARVVLQWDRLLLSSVGKGRSFPHGVKGGRTEDKLSCAGCCPAQLLPVFLRSCLSVIQDGSVLKDYNEHHWNTGAACGRLGRGLHTCSPCQCSARSASPGVRLVAPQVAAGRKARRDQVARAYVPC